MEAPPDCESPCAAFSSGAVEAHPTLEYQTIKGDKTYVETPPDCESPCAAFSSGAVEAHPTLEYQTIKSDKTYVEAPWLWRLHGCGGPWPTIHIAPFLIQPCR